MNLKPGENSTVPPKHHDEGQEEDYEQMLQRLEEEARDHIRIEQQLKLHIDSLQDKIEDMDKSARELQNQLAAKTSACTSLEQELKSLNAKHSELKQRTATLERGCAPFSTVKDSSYSQISINAEEKVGKLHNDLSRMKCMGDLAKRV
eukprot:TRINITY_DN14319_c0_g1_i22.p2 TRINITY_DN14319_c0_g1~~TRINITY_DN14319_c0_g1_i22.p2  ORF type:complete len:148 (+),score=37.48 TRINITY_DN14319_c0_g1_i22:423-866(+)